MEGPGPLLESMIQSHVETIRHIQGYLIRIHLRLDGLDGSTVLPPFQEFIEDVLVLIKVLTQEVLSDVPRPHQPGSHPFILVDKLRQDSWDLRWGTTRDTLRLTWDVYRSSLCDVLFGPGIVPQEPANPLGFGMYGITPHRSTRVSSLLESLSLERHPPSTMRLNLSTGRLKASYIERYGPYRFERTSNVADHLLIVKDNRILFFADWQSFFCFPNNRILDNIKKCPTKFDYLVCEEKEYVSPVRYYYHHLMMDLCAIEWFLFMVNEESVPGREGHERTRVDIESGEYERHYTWLRFFRPKVLWKAFCKLITRDKSIAIAKRLGIQLKHNDTGESNAELFLRWNGGGPQIESPIMYPIRSENIFKERLRLIDEALKDWKPRTIWELRYSGYGGVDPVALYAFYFATVFGIVEILGLVADVLSTYATMRQLQVLSS